MRELARAASPRTAEPPPADARILQSVGMFDAANGTVRRAVAEFAPDTVIHLGWSGVGNRARNNSVQVENVRVG